jgi:AcrR family transcriptional regulator
MTGEKTEKVLEAARQVFLRYGYKRTTMGDIAEAAKMSRPAVYLVFPSKEEIFGAVMARYCMEKLELIRRGLGDHPAAQDRLGFVLELWCVQPFEMTLASPDARDLLESGYEVANEIVTAAFAEFERVVAGILEPLVAGQTRVALPSSEIARLLIEAIVGFKQSATDVADLRQMIAGLLTITCASLSR